MIARDDVQSALRFVQRLEQRCQKIVDMPGVGRREDLALGLRSVVEGNYIIFCRVAGEDVVIQRILQGSRDLPIQFD